MAHGVNLYSIFDWTDYLYLKVADVDTISNGQQTASI